MLIKHIINTLKNNKLSGQSLRQITTTQIKNFFKKLILFLFSNKFIFSQFSFI